jgi:hypothetical protein
MVDTVAERVLEAALLDWTSLADATGDLDSDTVGRKEGIRGVGGTVACGHPAGVHSGLLASGPLARCVSRFMYYAQIAGKVPIKLYSTICRHVL